MFNGLCKCLAGFGAARSGQIAVVVAVAAPVILGSAGLGLETGFWFYKQRTAQMSADLSAYAGAVVARMGEEEAAIIAGAELEAAQNGYEAGKGPITVNWPPLGGANINDRSVEVEITQSYPRLFSGLFVDGDVSLVVRAVAQFEEPGPACILTLDPAGSQTLLFTGSSDVTLTNCDIMSNSIASDALAVTGSGAVIASCANSVGGINVSSLLTLTDCLEPRINLPPALDPFAGLSEPSATGCSNIPGGNRARTISPGRYCNGMNLSGDITLSPGVYIVDGGTLRTNGNSNITGDGVTIFLTNDADVQWNGNADINLTAPTSGPYAGLLLWGDKDNQPDTSAIFNGAAGSSLAGALYFPSQTVDMRGDFQGSGGCTRIIGWRIDISGNTSFDSDCSAAGSITINTPGVVRLVE